MVHFPGGCMRPGFCIPNCRANGDRGTAFRHPLFGHVETKNGNEIANMKNPKNDFRHHTFWQRMVPGDVNVGWVKPNYS